MRFLIQTSAALGLMFAAHTAMAQDTAQLTLNVETGAQTGTVQVAIFDSEAAYEGNQPVRAVQLDVATGEHQVVIDGLAPGTYGIKSFHDVNGNGKMDANPFGMPTEPYAFSNNAVGNMGPAKWDRAQFEITGQTTHTLNLR